MNQQATKKQLWTLYVLTHKDYRGSGITKAEASQIIKEAILEKLEEVKKVKEVISEAIEEGLKAAEGITPPPLVVNQGSVSVHLPYTTPENRKFINAGKRAGLIAGRHRKPENAVFTYAGQGYTHHISLNTPLFARKQAYAEAFARVLKEKAGLQVYVNSRVD